MRYEGDLRISLLTRPSVLTGCKQTVQAANPQPAWDPMLLCVRIDDAAHPPWELQGFGPSLAVQQLSHPENPSQAIDGFGNRGNNQGTKPCGAGARARSGRLHGRGTRGGSSRLAAQRMGFATATGRQ